MANTTFNPDGASRAQLTEAIRRALHDYTDAEIDRKVQVCVDAIAEINASLAANYASMAELAALEARIAALEGGGGNA